MAYAREEFSSRFGFVMAAAGSAVGLGNIWGFPTQAASNGGAAFLLVDNRLQHFQHRRVGAAGDQHQQAELPVLLARRLFFERLEADAGQYPLYRRHRQQCGLGDPLSPSL